MRQKTDPIDVIVSELYTSTKDQHERKSTGKYLASYDEFEKITKQCYELYKNRPSNPLDPLFNIQRIQFFQLFEADQEKEPAKQIHPTGNAIMIYALLDAKSYLGLGPTQNKGFYNHLKERLDL